MMTWWALWTRPDLVSLLEERRDELLGERRVLEVDDGVGRALLHLDGVLRAVRRESESPTNQYSFGQVPISPQRNVAWERPGEGGRVGEVRWVTEARWGRFQVWEAPDVGG